MALYKCKSLFTNNMVDDKKYVYDYDYDYDYDMI